MPRKSRKVSDKELIPVPHDALDQAAPMADLKTIVERVQGAIEYALAHDNSNAAWNMLRRMQDFGKVSGVGQAAAMWQLRKDIEKVDESDREYGTEEERDQAFYEIMFTKTGYTPETVRRYVLAWDFMASIRPRVADSVWESYLNRNIIDLIALGQSVREHGSMQKRTLEKLARTADNGSLRAELRKTWGEEAESNAMNWRLSPDGTLEVFQGDSAAYIGFLPPSGAVGDVDHELHRKARARLIHKLGIKETQS